MSPLLPNVDMWLWGHEHNLVIYEQYLGVLARCIGHGSFPVGLSEVPTTPKYPAAASISHIGKAGERQRSAIYRNAGGNGYFVDVTIS